MTNEDLSISAHLNALDYAKGALKRMHDRIESVTAAYDALLEANARQAGTITEQRAEIERLRGAKTGDEVFVITPKRLAGGTPVKIVYDRIYYSAPEALWQVAFGQGGEVRRATLSIGDVIGSPKPEKFDLLGLRRKSLTAGSGDDAAWLAKAADEIDSLRADLKLARNGDVTGW